MDVPERAILALEVWTKIGTVAYKNSFLYYAIDATSIYLSS